MMNISPAFKKFPLGLPLAALAVGTTASLLGDKRLHVGFGVAWLTVSLLHGAQHFGKLKKDASRLMPCGKSGNLRVSSSLPGRTRLYGDAWRGNPALARQVAGHIGSLGGVVSAVANPQTGSLLVLYDAGAVREKIMKKVLKKYLTTILTNGKVHIGFR